MIKILNVKKQGYGFTGFVRTGDLSPKQFEALDLKPSEPDLLPVEGEYEVDWDGRDPLPQIMYVWVSNYSGDILDLDETDVDFDDIAYKLRQQDDGSWDEDRLGSRIDYYYDIAYDN